LSAVLADMDADTLQGVRLLTTAAVSRHDPAPLKVIESFVADQRRDLESLSGDLSPAGRARAQTSLGLLDQVAQRSATLRTTLGCGSLAESVLDQLGPRPGRRCVAQQPTTTQPGGASPNQQPGGANRNGPAGSGGAPAEAG